MKFYLWKLLNEKSSNEEERPINWSYWIINLIFENKHVKIKEKVIPRRIVIVVCVYIDGCVFFSVMCICFRVYLCVICWHRVIDLISWFGLMSNSVWISKKGFLLINVERHDCRPRFFHSLTQCVILSVDRILVSLQAKLTFIGLICTEPVTTRELYKFL